MPVITYHILDITEGQIVPYIMAAQEQSVQDTPAPLVLLAHLQIGPSAQILGVGIRQAPTKLQGLVLFYIVTVYSGGQQRGGIGRSRGQVKSLLKERSPCAGPLFLPQEPLTIEEKRIIWALEQHFIQQLAADILCPILPEQQVQAEPVKNRARKKYGSTNQNM